MNESELPSVIQLAKAGDINAVAEAVERRGAAALTERSPHGWTPLMVAADYGHPRLVEFLLDQGAELEARDATGYTALMLAARDGRAETAEVLLDRGAAVEARSLGGATALMLGSARGYLDIVRLLLAHGADPAAVDGDGDPVWHYAANEGHDEIVDLLLQVEAERRQMAIVHDSYLFDPDRAGAALQAALDALRPDRSGYGVLRERALDLFARSERVRWFAAEYGGWGQPQIVEAIPADEPETTSDIAFWLMLIVSDHLVKPEGAPLGLGEYWRVLPAILAAAGWSAADADRLVFGRGFAELPGIGRETQASMGGVLEQISPASHGGRAGWLALDDARGYLAKLAEDRPSFASLNLALGAAHSFPFSRIIRSHSPEDVALEPDVIERAVRSATAMVESAVEQQSGLCQIVSG